MDADERNQWIDRSTKYLRLVAEHVETIVITTKQGDTITFCAHNEPGDAP